MVFLEFFPHIGDERLNLALKVRVQVGHHTADDIVILYKASTGGFFKDVHDFFTVTHPIDKGRQCAHIHTHSSPGQQVRSDTGQLIHDSTYHFDVIGHFNAGSLFNAHAQGVAVDVGREVIQSVREVEKLGIGPPFTQLFDTSVDIPTVDIDLFDDFAVQRCPEVQDTVSGRVLRTDVEHVSV